MQNGRMLFAISDNGTGIAENELEKVFEPLYTSDPSRKVAGLGLSICKSIVETHGGSIRAYNNPSGGLTIYFSLT